MNGKRAGARLLGGCPAFKHLLVWLLTRNSINPQHAIDSSQGSLVREEISARSAGWYNFRTAVSRELLVA
jgi:hypothetical protein